MTPPDIAPGHWALSASIPHSWSAGHFPRLRHLELQDFVIPWKTESEFPFRSLLTLKLGITSRRGVGLQPTYLPSLPTLLSVLDQMPELRVLHLNHIIPTMPLPNADLSPPPRMLSLPRLTELHLSGKAHECANIRRCLEIPGNTMLQSFHLTSQDGTGDDFLLFTPFLDSFVRLFAQTCGSLAVEDMGQHILIMLPMTPMVPSHPRIELRCSFDTPRDSSEDNIFPSLFRHCSFDHIMALIVRSQVWTTQRWMNVFCQFKALRIITIGTTPLLINGLLSFPTVNNFFDALAHGTRTHTSEANLAVEDDHREHVSDILFPSLAAVRFLSVDFTHTDLNDNLREGLLAALESRQHSPSPIQRIQFVFCKISSRLLVGIRSVVPDVVEGLTPR